MTLVIYSDKFLLHDNPTHVENASRATAIINFLKKMPFYDKLNLIEPDEISEDEIEKVHDSEMIKRAKKVGWLDMDTYTNEFSYEVAKLAAGGAIKACDEIIEGKDRNAFAILRPPGHHATRHASMGFCIFNNAGIAGNWLAEKGKRVLIFDHDVHHGNGTQDIFYERCDVLYQSIHLYPHYPGTGRIEEVGTGEGEGYTVNAPLPYGSGEGCVRKIMDEIMIPIAKEFSPDFVIISAGFDSHYADPLGGLALGINFYGEIIEKFKGVQEKIVCLLEGGYLADNLARGVAIEISHLVDEPISFEENVGGKECDRIVEEIKRVMKNYWNL
ncbi:MAG: histone deacetylase [Thermoplasmatales archaeon]|nr:histone deacetylase [Thermoplasmatales archaeon]